MYSDMGRRPAISEDELLAAARAVFLEKGIAATTADVANRCGVSEATVFRRFPTKTELFRNALVFRPPDWIEDLPDLAGQGDPHDLMAALVRRIAEFYRKVLPLASLALIDPEASWHERRQLMRQTALARLLEFFKREQQTGRLKLEPQFAARLFASAIASHVLLGAFSAELGDEAAFFEQLADLFWGPRKAKRRR